jgi:hypothetical protein
MQQLRDPAELETEVIQMIAKERGIRFLDVFPEKSLNLDLGMDGDDAVDFFTEFGERFQVDLAELGEEWHKYFGSEGFSLFDTQEVITLFTARPVHQGPMLPLHVYRVITAAMEGKWTKAQEVPIDDY